ncbi:MAG: peptide ABC transporter substrate-binding protein [Chloroflexia bacterium]|nr:peptide ABC transporter substrate-binding protein [Chloroflexia bacterium]
MAGPRHEGQADAWRREQEQGQGRSAQGARERDALWQTLRASGRTASRRDLLRWSAIVAGATTTARLGIGPAASTAAARQDGPVVADAEIVVPFDAYGRAVTLDPHRSADYGGFWVLYPNVWAGLLGYDETGRVVRDLAADAVVSADGLTYTFTLLPDLFYASGNPVLAEHFVASWQRALDPANLSPMAAFMAPVSGVADLLAGQADAELGFSAPDDLTVVVELAEPINYFPSYMAAFVWAVVDPAVLESSGQENFVLNGAGAGQWQFSEYELDTRVEMIPNPNFGGQANPSIVSIQIPILTGPTAAREALDLYLADEAVSADVPLSLMAEVEADPTLAAELVRLDQNQGSVRSLAMDFNQPPFDDVRVRRAFGLAFDRAVYAEIYAGTWTPTSSFTPPVVTELSGYQPPSGIETDIEAAVALLSEAGYPNGEGLPEITFFLAAEESEAETDRVRSVLDMLGRNLGVTLLFDNTRTLEALEALRQDTGGRQLDIIWWQNVTNSPHLLSEVFRPDSPYMAGVFNWSPELEPVGESDPGAAATEFADLMAQADVEQDPNRANELYAQGEELVLANAVYVPIANWVPMFVQKPWLQGTRQGAWTGRLPVRFDAAVVVVEG